ncbi:hypothetical protein D9756_006858 [Leucocoprinus leucothites]|uniref:Uncharacterized protein n=1 Tax=Leucocoprinus leucothites TaxID=201217 RepID=A0A8H5G2J6_9AGAR|nr:hypothetical protein D9756_006858 [Leucoagaricus leucothites]
MTLTTLVAEWIRDPYPAGDIKVENEERSWQHDKEGQDLGGVSGVVRPGGEGMRQEGLASIRVPELEDGELDNPDPSVSELEDGEFGSPVPSGVEDEVDVIKSFVVPGPRVTQNNGEEVPKQDIVGAPTEQRQLPQESSTRINDIWWAGPAKETKERRERDTAIEAYFHTIGEKEDERHQGDEEEGEDLAAYYQKIAEQANARDKRAKRRSGAKKQPVPSKEKEEPQQRRLTKKEKSRLRQEAKKQKKREEEAELARLRRCEKELMALKASQSLGNSGSHASSSSSGLHHGVGLSKTSTRIEVLKRAMQGQHQVAESRRVDSSAPSSSRLFKEDSNSLGSSQLPGHTEQQQNAMNTSRANLRRVEEEERKFQFEVVIDLKGTGKRSQRDPGETPSEDDIGAVPKITKVAIALENTTEYRISVSGERPRKSRRL